MSIKCISLHFVLVTQGSVKSSATVLLYFSKSSLFYDKTRSKQPLTINIMHEHILVCVCLIIKIANQTSKVIKHLKQSTIIFVQIRIRWVDC